MSGSAYVVIPVESDGVQRSGQDTAKIASAIQESVYEKTHPKPPKEELTGPLTEILAHQDSLYRYISWEDPIITFFTYIGALSVLLGAHYLPLTQLGLKAGAVTLGVVSLTEFASRSFGSKGFLASVRPKEYKVPEETLNATLKDVHDLVQYSVRQTQRVIFGQDLEKTFAAFLGLTALYWLIKIATPFALAVLALTSVFIAPLILSPRGREVARDAKARAGQLTNAAVENGKALAEDGRAAVAEQSSKARETVADAGRRLGDVANSGKQTAADLSAQAKDTTSAMADGAAETGRNLQGRAADAGRRVGDVANSGKQTAADLASQAKDTTSATAGGVAETGRNLQGRGADASNQAASFVGSALQDTQHQSTGHFQEPSTGYVRATDSSLAANPSAATHPSVATHSSPATHPSMATS